MAAIIKSQFRYNNIEDFIARISSYWNDKIYIFIAKSSVWTDENAPDFAVDSNSQENLTRSEIIALKQITKDQISRVSRRYNWIAGTTYTAYKHTIELRYKNFYVMTNEFNVYKCIDNNNDSPSSTKPTGTSTNIITTADGYKWKFLFKLSEDDIFLRLTSEFIPVKTLLLDDGSDQFNVQQSAVDGGLDFIDVTAGGTGYTTANVIINTTTGSGAVATANLSSGIVTSITINNPGSGYKDATISITGNGSGATASAVISPTGGHGSNPIEELFSTFLLLPLALDGPEGGTFPVDADPDANYRRLGVLINPKLSGAPNTGSEFPVTYSDTFKQYIINEEVTLSFDPGLTPKKRVKNFNPVSGLLTLNDSSESNYIPGVTITGVTSGIVGTVPVGSAAKNVQFPLTASVSAADDVDLYSGELIYLENILKVDRVTTQKEQIKIVLEF